MNKKIISLVLALVMVLGTFTSVFAAETTTKPDAKKAEAGEKVEKVVGKDNKIQYIIDKKLVEGYEDGTYGLDKNIKRSEITRLLVLANGNEELSKKLQGSMKIYSDVDTKHWANGVITVGTTVPSDANGIAMLAGYPDGSFKPEKDVTYAELAKMLVVLAKKDLTADMVKNAIWASSWMTWAAELGILEDVTITDSNMAANRADAFTMVYNALYSMKYFKRTAANETMGIVSQLKNSEITLNQGEKAKTFKITNSTVFVLYNQHNTLDANADRKDAVKTINHAVKAAAITNPEYYYGSLVRVIADKDGNVTHILELGNPRYLALGHNDKDINHHQNIKANTIDPNNRWRDIADATIETSYTASMRDRLLKVNGVTGVAAKINYTNGNAKSIDFVEGTATRVPQNETGTERYNNNFNFDKGAGAAVNLRLTKTTRYFVADVERNQLTEVNNVDEAIRILGNTTASNWFFDVYAGYNDFSGIKNYKTANNTAVNGYKEATVVVFNSVQKDNNNAQVLRVTNETNSKYDLAFEDTNGNIINNNVATYRDYFPFGFGSHADSAKLDVVEYSYNNAHGIAVKGLIDHSKTSVYPIVKVTDIDERQIKVVDKDGDYAYLQLATDADIFLNGQLKVGALIQFHTLNGNKLTANVNETNVVDVVSVMPARYDEGMKGNLQGVVEDNQYNTSWAQTPALGDFEQYGAEYQKVILRNLRGLDGSHLRLDLTVMSNTEANALKNFLTLNPTYKEGIRFLLRHFDNPNHYEAYDVRVLVDGNWVRVYDKYRADSLTAVLADIDTLVKKDVTCDTYTKLREEATAIRTRISMLSVLEQDTFNTGKANEAYATALANFEAKIEEFEDAKNELDTEAAKITDDTINDVAKADLTQAGILAAAKTKVEGVVDTSKVTVTVELANAPKDNANYAAGAELKVKVSVKSVAKDCLKAVEKTITGNIEN